MKILFFALPILFCSCNKPTNGCFTHSPSTISSSQTITLDAACSQNASYFYWNFGDGSPDTMVTSHSITHVYNSAGNYSVTLSAKRKDGMTFQKGKPTITQTITIQ